VRAVGSRAPVSGAPLSSARARWLLALGALAVAALRWGLCLRAPDAIHPVDPAELDLLWLGAAWRGGGLDAAGLLRELGAAAVVHHGGFLPVSLLVALAEAVVGPGYPAIKLVAVALSTATWAAWTLLALRRGGGRAALLAGIALALPVPWATQWWLTGWGSHPEAALWTAAWLLGWEAPPGVLGLMLGIGVGFAPVLAPTALVLALLQWRRLPGLLGGALLGWLPLQAGALDTPWPWLRASLTEDPAQTAPALLRQALDPQALWASLRGHLPVPLVASAVVGAAAVPLSALLDLGLLGTGLPLARRPGVDRALLLLPLVHLLSVVALSPFRPVLQHRYLLPWLPAALLWPALAAARSRGWTARGAAILALLPSLLALPVLARLLLRSAPTDLWGYQPERYLAVGLDRVPLELAPQVGRWLETRGTVATQGFAAAWTRRWGYPVLGEPFAPLAPREGLRDRLRALARDTGQPAEALAADAGWGLGVVTAWDPAACLHGVVLLDELRDPALRGLGQGLAGLPAASTRAPVFVAAVAARDPAAAAQVQAGLDREEVTLRPQ